MSRNKSSDSIQVYARLRHTNNLISTNNKEHYSINQIDSSLTIQQLQHSKHRTKNKSQLKFGFNHIFKCETPQQHLFEKCGKPLVDQAIQGYNCTLLAYGQTGSGKTYSMLGPSITDQAYESLNSEHGLIYRCMNELFTSLKYKDKKQQQLTLIKCSFVEIYQDKMRDLLISTRVNSKQTKKTAFGKAVLNDENKEFEANNQLKIKMRNKGRKPSESYVSNLTEEYVTSMKDIEVFVGIAKARRATCATWANSYSSRSHWVMIVTIEQKTHDSHTTISKLNFVDLAGSEKVKYSGVTGNSLQEAKTINKSLHNLRLCISALAHKKPHCPYRDSTLTHLLQDSLGGNTKTSLLITLNMDRSMTEETISSCRFGGEAQQVVNVAKINKKASRKQLESLVAKLQKQLLETSMGNVDGKCDVSSAELYNARKRMSELEKCIANYEAMIARMKKHKAENIQTMKNLNKLCDELKQEREIVEDSVKALSKKLEKMRKNNCQLKEKNYKLKKDNDSLNKQMMTANNHIYDLQSTINRNDRMYVEVTNQNANLCQQFDDLKRSNENKFQLLLKEISVINREKGPDVIKIETTQKENIEDDKDDLKQQELPLTIPKETNRVFREELNKSFEVITNTDKKEDKIDDLSEDCSLNMPTELELEDNVIEYSIAPQPVICRTQLMEAYFTNIEDESFMKEAEDDDDQNEEIRQEGIPRTKKKITPKPLRLLIKIIRLISPKYKTPESYDDCSIMNVERHRKFSDDLNNTNQGYKAYITPGYIHTGDQQ